jgi:protein required for attachment to host cells
MKLPQTLYLLAADRDYRLLRGAGVDLTEIVHRNADDFRDVEMGFPSERGRGQAGGGAGGATGGVSFGTSDPGGREAEDRRRLARHALSALEAEWAKGRADRIILAAGPKMLGELRDLLPKGLAGHVTADLAKDLIKIPLHDLPSHFKDVSGV